MRTSIAILPLLAACGADPMPEAPPDAALTSENSIAPCGKPLVYLVTDGIDLVGAEVDEATRNESFLMSYGEFPIEPIADRVRAEEIEAKALLELAEQQIPATTTRPASGSYILVAIDGEVTGWEGDEGITEMSALDCDDSVASNVGLLNLGAHDGAGVGAVATTIRFAVGIAIGLSPTTAAPGSCMAYAFPREDCTFLDGVKPNEAASKCPLHGNEDQHARIVERLACP